MQPSGEAAWPESLRPLYEGVSRTSDAEAVSASAQWTESFAQWVRGASLEERNQAQLAAWERMASGARGLAELLFLVGSCSELLWPYAAPPPGLLERLLSRQAQMLDVLGAAGDAEITGRVRRETEASVSTVLTRYLKRHPDSLATLVGDVSCSFDGRALRFQDSVEVDLKRVMATGAKAIGMLEQLRALLPATAEAGRDRLADFIRTRASRIPWQEASEVLAERLFALATSPDGRGAMRGFLACYPNGRKEPEWCARAGLLLARTLEVGGPTSVVENLCELLARFDAPPVDGLRGAMGALVGSDFEVAASLEPVRFVLDHCQATLRKGEPGLVLALVWLEERLFRASVRKGLTDAFERRKRTRAKLEPLAPGFVQLCWLAEECADLWPRLVAVDARPGMDELAAWREDVAERVGRKPMLRKAAIEFFLWCAPDAASSEAELTVLSLLRTETDRRQVRKLKDHPSSRVRLRVRTLQRWLQGTGKEGPGVKPTGAVAPASLTEALRHLHVTRAVPLAGRTWLRDRDLEELLLGAVTRVETDFATRYPERFREDTEELVASLLEGLSGEMGRVKADLLTLLAQGQPPPLDFELTVRRVADIVPEEPLPPTEGQVGGEASALASADAQAPTAEVEGTVTEVAVDVASDEDAHRGDLARTETVRPFADGALAGEGPEDSSALDAPPDVVVPDEETLGASPESNDRAEFLTDAPADVSEADGRPGDVSALVLQAEVPLSETLADVGGSDEAGPIELTPTAEVESPLADTQGDEAASAGRAMSVLAESPVADTQGYGVGSDEATSAGRALSVLAEAHSADTRDDVVASDEGALGARSVAGQNAALVSDERPHGEHEVDGMDAAQWGEQPAEATASEAVTPGEHSGELTEVSGADDAQVFVSPGHDVPLDSATPAENPPDGTEPLPPLLAPGTTSAAESRWVEEATPTEAPSRPRAPKRKRAAKGATSRPTSGPEVAFVLDADVDGFVRTERAVLVQVVKLEQRGEGQWLPHFKLGREQLDGMLSRTDAAFCLFLVPPIPRAECWLLPARLVRELMEDQRSLSEVSRETVARAARSLAHWWMGDFVSLWTGDARPALLAHVSGHAKDGPAFIVRWSVRTGARTEKS
ncbi:hypothetical protein [Myxococcus sp. CA040A]|uniref:hypothetical protein n=1 Tax=Myxococcus sp. CA040A TaxID=2741738 RepID=UPI0020C6A948|nr:hypothetical protein [Myxococcus sp. CA040A]